MGKMFANSPKQGYTFLGVFLDEYSDRRYRVDLGLPVVFGRPWREGRLLKLTDQAWHEEIGKVVRALKTPDYTQCLVDALGHLVKFDFSVMFAYRGDERPIDLYDNFGAKRREIFVTLYQEGPYLLDPFFQASRDRIDAGLYRIRDLAPDRFYQSEYFRSYYIKTGLSEEIGFFIPLPDDVRAVISLMRAGNRQVFNEREMTRLRSVEPFVRATAEHHWQALSARFADSDVDPEHRILERYIDYTFRNFGRSLLSPREREVVGLVLRGHSSDSISKVLGISPGTVKVHRKNIYAKLGIMSQSELFSIFLNTLSKSKDPIAAINR